MFGRINELTEEVNVLVGKPTYVIMVIANEPLILSGTLVRILQHKVIYSSLEVDGHAPILQTSKQRLRDFQEPFSAASLISPVRGRKKTFGTE